tara:strand:- start:104 stop:1810 length:1707 start_codon:yes stop_codon:yes gene_type:complete
MIEQLLTGIPENFLIVFEIGIMIIIAAVLSYIIRLFKQPLIPAYILTGILIGPLFLGLISDQELIVSLAEIGVAFLIFTAGLEINFRKLKQVGKAASFGGTLQIALLFAIAFFVSTWLGFIDKAPIYIGLVVAFSSTMVVIKLLYDRKEINSLHGRIIIGILLIQDIAAIAALAILTTDLSLNSILIALGKALIFVVLAIILSKAINPVFKRAARSTELLLLVAISFLFMFSIGAVMAQLSLVIGAFLAGVALANSDYKIEIESKIAPIGSFFAVIFFVALGMQLRLISGNFLVLLLALLLLVIIIKPLVLMFLVRIFGYSKRTSFLTGNSLAQTSEFSLVIATLGYTLGHISVELFSTLILLTIVTMSLTTYYIGYERQLFSWFSWPLNIFNKFKSKKEELEYSPENNKKIIIFGCHRMGSLFLKDFQENKKNVMVVDYNPEIIASLINKKIPCIYGDFIDKEILEKINTKNAEMIISTIMGIEDNLLLIKKIKQMNPGVPTIVTADRISEALELYDAGAEYVILPQIIGAQRAFELLQKIKSKKDSLRDLKRKHIKYLNSIHRILY